MFCFVFSVYFSNFINHLKELGLAKSYSKAAMLIRLHGGSVSIVPTSMMTNQVGTVSLQLPFSFYSPVDVLLSCSSPLPPPSVQSLPRPFLCGDRSSTVGQSAVSIDSIDAQRTRSSHHLSP